ncbi:MAG: ribonuclease domain-containing protein [Burkholderiales bacterium]
MAQRSRIVLWAAIAAVVAGSAVVLARGDLPGSGEIRVQQLPPEARHTLQLIRRDGPYPYQRDGSTFGNYEKRLPAARRGYYSEYTVATPGLNHRGARRIVVGCERQQPVAPPPSGVPGLAYCRNGGVAYYTADHYNSFRRIVK